MSRIAFFNIPAYGHTNPTLEVVRELVKRGHEVHYYSFREFRDRIENTGAACICCDEYMPPAPADIDKKVGRDLASLISMTVHVTLAMEERILKEFGEARLHRVRFHLHLGKALCQKAGNPLCVFDNHLCVQQVHRKADEAEARRNLPHDGGDVRNQCEDGGAAAAWLSGG